ncbi:radical SAM protein [Candidatus Bathyarchaeota archaeon]|nr:radical SAM protein [Candidatus Bathyarchaeota archaeon]
MQKNLNQPRGPRIISWNTTLKCNLRCSHCYINAQDKPLKTELTTVQGKQVIDQIAELGRCVLVLSGGEPLLRSDIFELAEYALQKNLIPTLGTNGTLIDKSVAERIRGVGIQKVAISLDSSTPPVHDSFRGVEGAWDKAVAGIKACIDSDVEVQLNVTMTKQNYTDLDKIIEMAKGLGVKSMHLFFLVPTGRGRNLLDLSPETYEQLLRDALSRNTIDFEVKPTCAPQFMRVAKQMGADVSRWSRGCIAGVSYCRILPDGQVTPCPYLPVSVGNMMATPLSHIWANSEVLNTLRDSSKLKGKCGKCDYNSVCGGCRARAYGLTSYCSGASVQSTKAAVEGDFLAADPWCTYSPTK